MVSPFSTTKPSTGGVASATGPTAGATGVTGAGVESASVAGAGASTDKGFTGSPPATALGLPLPAWVLVPAWVQPSTNKTPINATKTVKFKSFPSSSTPNRKRFNPSINLLEGI